MVFAHTKKSSAFFAYSSNLLELFQSSLRLYQDVRFALLLPISVGSRPVPAGRSPDVSLFKVRQAKRESSLSFASYYLRHNLFKVLRSLCFILRYMLLTIMLCITYKLLTYNKIDISYYVIQ